MTSVCVDGPFEFDREMACFLQHRDEIANWFKMKMRRLLMDWVPVIAWMCLIFAGSTDLMSAEHTSRFLVPFLRWLDPHVSFKTIALVQLIVRKVGHVTEYAILAALLWRALRHYWSLVQRSFWKSATIALTVALIYATADEFHQSFVLSRTATVHDVVMDIVGALVGLTICWMFVRNRQTPATDTL
jgi:VanZ family protein